MFLLASSDGFLYVGTASGVVLEFQTSDYAATGNSFIYGTGSDFYTISVRAYTMSHDEKYIAFITSLDSERSSDGTLHKIELVVLIRKPLGVYQRYMTTLPETNTYYSYSNANGVKACFFIPNTYDLLITGKWKAGYNDPAEIRKLTWQELENNKLESLIWQEDSTHADARSVYTFSDTQSTDYSQYRVVNVLFKPRSSRIFAFQSTRYVHEIDSSTWNIIARKSYSSLAWFEYGAVQTMSPFGEFFISPVDRSSYYKIDAQFMIISIEDTTLEVQDGVVCDGCDEGQYLVA